MGSTLRHDPAIEQFNKMRDNTHKNFRFTRKTGPFVFITAALVPAVLLWGAYRYSGQTDFTAKRRNESVWRSHDK